MEATALTEVAGDRRAEQVQQMLVDLARQLGPNSKLPTTRSLRKSMRVSQATLDAALNGMELQGLIHRRQGSGVYVSPLVRLRRIAVVFAHGVLEARMETYEHLLYRALRPEARRRHALVSYHYSDNDRDEHDHGPHQLAIDAEQGRVDAIVVRGPLHKQIKELQSIEIPRVFLTYSKSSIPRVEMNSRDIISMGVRLLAERGCRQIAFAYAVYPGEQSGDNSLSVQRFKDAVAAHGLEFNEDWLIPFSGESIAMRSLEGSSRFYHCWQDWARRPQGIVCTDDLFTSGIVHSCQLLGLRIPEQFAIATHANKGLEVFAGAPVIRLEFDPNEVARAVLDTIDELLEPGAAVTEVRMINSKVVMPTSAERAIFSPPDADSVTNHHSSSIVENDVRGSVLA